MQSIKIKKVDMTLKTTMFVLWTGPQTEYLVKVWTPNGGGNSTLSSSFIAQFDNINYTKPYYVSIEPSQTQPSSCLPKGILAGMFYMHAKRTSFWQNFA